MSGASPHEKYQRILISRKIFCG